MKNTGYTVSCTLYYSKGVEPTDICSSEEKESMGERVPLVRMMDLTPCAVSSAIAWPGLKHQ